MITIKDRQAFNDLSVIFTMMPKSMFNKINKKFIEFIENNKDSSYIPNINPYQPLNKQHLEEITDVLLAIIYKDYLCDNQDQSIFKNQDIKGLEELKIPEEEKYDMKFKKNNTSKVNIKESVQLQAYKKENIFSNILYKVKNFFKTKFK